VKNSKVSIRSVTHLTPYCRLLTPQYAMLFHTQRRLYMQTPMMVLALASSPYACSLYQSFWSVRAFHLGSAIPRPFQWQNMSLLGFIHNRIPRAFIQSNPSLFIFCSGCSKEQMPYPIQNQHHTHYHPGQFQYRHFVSLRRHAAQACRAAF
jgi:hypothetical protein